MVLSSIITILNLEKSSRAPHYLARLCEGRNLMLVTVNGEEKQLKDGMTVGALIDSFGFVPQKVAFERNLEIVRKSDYNALILQDGDKVEIVHFIGGG